MVGCHVELYGSARLLTGLVALSLPLAEPTSLVEVIARLARAQPALVGPVIAADGQSLVEGYIINRNGRDFLASPEAMIQPGDRLLLVASLAGGAP